MKTTLIVVFLFSSVASADVFDYPKTKLHLSLGIANPSYNLEFQDKETEKKVSFKPNANSLLVPGFTYRGLFGWDWVVGLSWGFRQKILQENIVKFGESKYDHFRFKFTFKSFLVEVYYSQFRGFYIEDSKGADPSWDGSQPNLQYPDMYARTTGGTFTWVYHPEEYSIAGIVNQTERQAKSGGSWLSGASINQTVFSNDTGLIPITIRDQFGVGQDLTKGKFSALQVNCGYGYTLGTKWFVGGLIRFGLGAQLREAQLLNSESLDGWGISSKLDAFITTGYNGDDFFTVIRSNAQGNIYNGLSSKITSTQNNFSIVLGWHI